MELIIKISSVSSSNQAAKYLLLVELQPSEQLLEGEEKCGIVIKKGQFGTPDKINVE